MNGFIVTRCSGFSKEEAFSKLDFDPTKFKGSNRTRSWKKDGCPTPGTSEFNMWAQDQLNEINQDTANTGLYIVLNSGVPDTRLCPCRVVNKKTPSPSSWVIEYWIREDVLDIGRDGSINVSFAGNIVDRCSSKRRAMEKARQLTIRNKKSYSLLRVKVPSSNFIAGYSVYVPSSRAQQGTYVAFGYVSD